MTNPLSKFGLTDMELDAEMARNPEVLKGLEELAHRVEDSLKAKAPVFDPVRDKRQAPPDADSFIDSIHTEMARKDGKPGALVGSSHYLALPIEVGDLHMPEFAIFSKTALEFGDTTGPVFSSGLQQAQDNLRQALATGASKSEVKRLRIERSAAFRASRHR